MEVFGLIAFIFIIILVMLIVLIPSIIMVWGMIWASKNWFPHRTWWVRWAGVLGVLFIIPQMLNVSIENDVTKLVSKSHGKISNAISARIIAVEPYDSNNIVVPSCNQDCILLLLSGKIDQYLVVRRPPDHAHPIATAFKFVKNSDCSFMNEFSGRSLSAKLENTVRELSLSGTCITASETTLEVADILVTYDEVQHPSWLVPGSKGHQISVLRKDQKNGEWVEIYKDITIRYASVFPPLLPVFTLDKKRPSIDILRRTMFRTHDKKSACSQDWFSDYGACHRQLRRKSASAILGISVSEYSLEKSGIIAAKSDRTTAISSLVKSIVLEERRPNVNEWALINGYISREYYESEAYARLVIDVMSYDNFPVPRIYSGVDKFNGNHKTLLASAIVNRIKNDTPGPEIGRYDKKQQWYNLYKILEKLSVDTLDPHFEVLVKAVSKRPYSKQYVEFLEKFGSRSRQPILNIIESDERRLKSLSPIMCNLGSNLSGIEGPLLEMAQRHHITLGGNGRIVYLLLDLGVDEDRILSTVNLSGIYASKHTNSINRYIKIYKSGKTHCR